MLPRPRARSAAPIALGALLLAVAHLNGRLELLLPFIPLLVLLFSLLAGVYPGCEVIVRLSEHLAVRRRRAAVVIRAHRPRPRRHAVSGGLLIALGHAQRPPPLAPAPG